MVSRASGVDIIGTDRYVAMQESLTAIVENIPPKLQRRDKLHEHFDELFPGEIYSAIVLLRHSSDLETKILNVELLEEYIEKAEKASEGLHGTERNIQQCRWAFGQPHCCLCCCIGQPDACMCLHKACPALYEDSDLRLNEALRDQKRSMEAIYQEKVAPQIIKLQPAGTVQPANLRSMIRASTKRIKRRYTMDCGLD